MVYLPWNEGREAAEKMTVMQTQEKPPQWYSERQVRQWYGGLVERAAEIARASQRRGA